MECVYFLNVARINDNRSQTNCKQNNLTLIINNSMMCMFVNVCRILKV